MTALRRFFTGAEAEAGQAIILIALTLLGMLMMVGVAIDAGQLYSARRSMQEAADAAAYAGSVVLYQGGTQAQAFAAAAVDATANGFTNGVNNTTITIRQPLAAPYNTSAYVEVLITQQVRTALVPGQNALTQASVRAISGAEPLNNEYAIMALDRNATDNAFQSGPTAQIRLSGGGVLVNSSSSAAANSATPAGNWNISCTSSSPCAIDVGGTGAGSWPAAAPGNPTYFNGERNGQPQQTDPFAGYPKPSTSGMLTDRSGFGTGNATLGQGIYTSATSFSNKKLCHGIYILKGGGMGGDLDIDTTSVDPVTLTPCDGKVFIFNTMTNYPASGGTCTGVTVSGNHDITLNAMTTGTYAGLLFYQDSACTAGMVFGGTSFSLTATGTIYVPNASFTADGSPTIAGGQIVAKTVNLGNADIDITFNPGTSAQPILPRLAK